MCSTLKNSNNNKVAIVLTQGFADWEYALIAGVGKSFYGLDVEFFSPDTGEIVSQGGLVTTVSQNIDQISTWSPKVVAVIGGTLWASENAPDISKLLKMQHLDGGIVAGICGGTLALARAKLLDETMHTSNDSTARSPRGGPRPPRISWSARASPRMPSCSAASGSRTRSPPTRLTTAGRRTGGWSWS